MGGPHSMLPARKAMTRLLIYSLRQELVWSRKQRWDGVLTPIKTKQQLEIAFTTCNLMTNCFILFHEHICFLYSIICLKLTHLLASFSLITNKQYTRTTGVKAASVDLATKLGDDAIMQNMLHTNLTPISMLSEASSSLHMLRLKFAGSQVNTDCSVTVWLEIFFDLSSCMAKTGNYLQEKIIHSTKSTQ